MKKYTIITLLTLALVFVVNIALSQGPPDPPGDPGTGGGPVGGAAPIEGGIGFLLGLAAAWGGRKAYLAFKQKNELEE